MITAAAPTRVWQRLTAAPDGPRPVVHTGSSAVYVDLDGSATGCVGIVSATATRVPCALWTGLPALDAWSGHPVHVAGGTLVVGDEPVRIARLVDVRLRVPQAHLARPHGPRPPARPSLGASELGPLPADGRLSPHHVARLVGRGPGLTPLGDDVLAGWLAVRVAAGARDPDVEHAVRRSWDSTTTLSASLLDCSLHGEALPQLGAWLAARGTPGEATAEAALLAVGASSGAGLLAGATLALASLDTLSTDHPGRVA